MTPIETLTRHVATAQSLEASVSLLVTSLAERIKATSNDQNIQNLARELKGAAPALVEAIAHKAAALAPD